MLSLGFVAAWRARLHRVGVGRVAPSISIRRFLIQVLRASQDPVKSPNERKSVEVVLDKAGHPHVLARECGTDSSSRRIPATMSTWQPIAA